MTINQSILATALSFNTATVISMFIFDGITGQMAGYAIFECFLLALLIAVSLKFTGAKS